MHTNPNHINRQLRKAEDKMYARDINNFKGNLIASGESGQLYASCYNSCGYLFMKLTIIGKFRAEMDELKVQFSSKSKQIEVETDHRDIRTDFSPSMGVGITHFDVLVEEELMEFIQSENLTTISVLKRYMKGFWKPREEVISYDFNLEDKDQLKKEILEFKKDTSCGK